MRCGLRLLMFGALRAGSAASPGDSSGSNSSVGFGAVTATALVVAGVQLGLSSWAALATAVLTGGSASSATSA